MKSSTPCLYLYGAPIKTEICVLHNLSKKLVNFDNFCVCPIKVGTISFLSQAFQESEIDLLYLSNFALKSVRHANILCKGIRVSPQIRVLPSGTFSQTLSLCLSANNFPTKRTLTYRNLVRWFTA